MNGLVNLACAKVQMRRRNFMFRRMDQLICLLPDPFILTGRNGYDWNSQELTQFLDMNGVPAGAHLIHHIQSNDHRLSQLHQLQGEIKIPLNIRRIHNIQDAVRIFLQDKIPGNDLL